MGDFSPGHVVVHTDSKAALLVITSRRLADNIHLLSWTYSLLNNLRNSGCQVVLKWVLSHSGVQGNEDS